MAVTTFSGLVGDLGRAGWLGKQEKEASKAKARETTGGGDDEPVRWLTVATAMGEAEASLIVGRLENEGIPARISQEAAGHALGLTVGLFQIRVVVPEEVYQQALDVLKEPPIINDDDWRLDAEEYE